MNVRAAVIVGAVAYRGAAVAMRTLQRTAALRARAAARGGNGHAEAGGLAVAHTLHHVKRRESTAVCFVAGTGVWTLAGGLTMAEEHEALANGVLLKA